MKRKFEKATNDSLSEEITQKFEKIKKESEENKAVKHGWVDELQSLARQKYPSALLVLTGSSGNMFGFKESDCDLTLISGERNYVYSVTALGNIEKLLPKTKYRTEASIVSFISYMYCIQSHVRYVYHTCLRNA
jgi:DNA polymerase sigma